MTDLNHLFILIINLLQWQRLESVQCCTNLDCSLTKNCSNDVSHCIFAGRPLINKTYSDIIEFNDMELNHFECWMWPHEVIFCPKTPGDCFSVHNHSSFKTFCCAGNLCNKPQNLTCQIKNNDITWKIGTFPPDKSSTPASDHPSPISATYIIIIVFIIVLVATIIVYFTYRLKCLHLRHAFAKGPVLINGVSYVSDRATYMSKLTNGNYSVSDRHGFNTEVFKASDLYEKCEKKCVGKFGEIWTGKFKSGFSESAVKNVAIKIFRPRDESSWETEIEMYRYIGNRCPRILTYVGCDKITNYNQTEELWLVTQYMDSGSLHDYLSDQSNVRPTWSQVLRMCLDIAGGLSYLHEDGSYQSSAHISGKPSIAHRDLKSRNILIRDNWNACIADLGLALSFHGNPSPTDLHLQVGTQRYMAPEVLEGAINFSRDSFLGIDIYAMALIFWEICSQCIDAETMVSSGCLSTDTIGQYMQPFDHELGPHITMESLQAFVVNDNKRPQMPTQFVGFEDGLVLWKTIVECWDRDAEARLSSSCVYARLVSLSEKSASLVGHDGLILPGPDTQPLLL